MIINVTNYTFFMCARHYSWACLCLPARASRHCSHVCGKRAFCFALKCDYNECSFDAKVLGKVSLNIFAKRKILLEKLLLEKVFTLCIRCLLTKCFSFVFLARSNFNIILHYRLTKNNRKVTVYLFILNFYSKCSFVYKHHYKRYLSFY